MARNRASFVCQSCGARAPRWMGRCPACGEWNGLVAAVETPAAPVLALPVDSVPAVDGERLRTGCPEFDRVLGGGIVAGTLTLLGGDPGVGKSTLLLQVAGRLAASGDKVVYASGEESAHQLRGRAERLGVLSSHLLVAPETDAGAIAAEAERHGVKLLIVDSVQTARTSECPLPPGSPVQVREVALRLLEFAKGSNIPVMLVGHVTKAGALAGPRVLEHMVDVVMHFEGERFSAYRLLRAVKNRFGSVQELGVFEMVETGLREVPNPSAQFLAERAAGVPGSVVTVTLEGSRPILCEVQALVAPPAFAAPRRTAAGIDVPRLAVLLAVLERRAHVRCGHLDAYLRVAGGLRLEEPATDLACALALASACADAAVPQDTVAIGEIGLGGELRGGARLPERLAEAERLGFRHAIVPVAARRAQSSVGPLRVTAVGTLQEAVQVALTRGGGRRETLPATAEP